jgi:long-chain acyl-CoA synthetase
MGNEVFNESNPYQYGAFKTEPKLGETPIIVRPDSVKSLSKKNFIDRYTQLDCVEYYKEKRPNSNFIGSREYNPNTKKYGKYIWKSWAQVYDLATFFLYGISKFNICPEVLIDDDILGKNKKMKFMGFYCRTREEWTVGSFGCQMDSITIITIYDTLGMSSLEFILKQTELTTILAETINLEKILQIKEGNKLGNVKNIIYIHCNEEKENLEEIKEKLKNLGLNLISYETILETGKKCIEEKDNEILNKKYKKLLPDDIFLICYTSGTTSNPKGAMISQGSFLFTPNYMYNVGYHLTAEDRQLSFLPYAHLLEQMFFTVNLVFGAQTGYYSGSTSRLFEDLQELKPTFFCAVPRIYERIYNKIMDDINKKGPLFKKTFDKALAVKKYNYEKYGKLSHPFFDLIFFNKIRNLLGGKTAFMLSGSAAMKKDIIENLRVMISCPFSQLYGLTEGAGTAFLSSIYDTFAGIVGGVDNRTEFKLVDLPDFNYLSTDINPETGISEPRGEICFRGIIFKGYFKNIEETNNLIDKDGWVHSGDVGILLTNHGNSLKIIDRVKNLFKLNQGEFVSPEKVQKVLINSKYINQIFLHGESQYNYAIALVYPELNACIKFLRENKKMGDMDYDKISLDNLMENKIMEEEIIKDCDKVGRQFDLKGYELPKKIRIINEPFSVENNLMSDIMKLKPKNIRSKYNYELKKMYEEKL